MSETMSGGYSAESVESKWYKAWEQAGLFTPDEGSQSPVYSITIPPPNITGSLHMGHALCYPLQDLLGRYKRLKGYSVLILPGQDHAGIATQAVVDKQIRKEGSSAFQLGREKFIERAWQWREESGDTILNQFRRLGCAFDWTRQRFTLDPEYVRAVQQCFINWFDRGLIYRGKRVVNWDPSLKTSVSDIETERQLIQGKLYHVRYKFTDGSGEIIVATTRPETILGDVAVAVHPSDKRYEGKIGKTLVVPIVGREVPLIADEYPDPEFGTGAVKITPGHDPNDYEVGRRHDLPLLIVLDERAKVNSEGGKYEGLDRFKARNAILEDLEAAGLLAKVEDHEIAVLVSERSKDIIEPLASEQWFVNQSELSKEAIKVVEEDQIAFFPDRYKGVYLEWMNNLRDWCISRQLWWGHRIPVYYTESGEAFAAFSWEEAQEKAGEQKIVRQDDDVLDTWFSSGLWPFATLGWPNETPDLEKYYPTDVLVTSREILFLWVARMIMMGLDFRKEIPFREVYIYATVLTEDGKRMSKSLGTGVDPIEIIETKGADALRFTLFSQTGLNQDIRYSERKTTDARNFCNKIWNAAKFLLLNLPDGIPTAPEKRELMDDWILSRLVACEEEVTRGIEGYDIQAVTQALYQFFWSELCDWYIEVSKHRLQGAESADAARWTLVYCLDAFLKMMHPVMPHITEEIYSLMPGRKDGEFLMAATWPEIPAEWRKPDLEVRIERWFELVRGVRALRAEAGISPKEPLEALNFEGNLDGSEDVILSQAWIKKLVAGPVSGEATSSTVAEVDFHISLEGLIDPEKELARLTKDLEKTTDERDKLKRQIENQNFVERAKPEVVEKIRTNLAELESKLQKIEERLSKYANS